MHLRKTGVFRERKASSFPASRLSRGRGGSRSKTLKVFALFGRGRSGGSRTKEKVSQVSLAGGRDAACHRGSTVPSGAARALHVTRQHQNDEHEQDRPE